VVSVTGPELAAKVDWEGGVAEAITGYGLTLDDLPEDAPAYIKANWKIVQESASAIERIQVWLDEQTSSINARETGDA
jgi:hypothetical protein